MAFHDRARVRHVAILAALIGLAPAALLAQRSVRVRWPLIDFVISGDSASSLMFLMSPNRHARSDPSVKALAWVSFDPAEALQWTATVRQTLESSATSATATTPIGPLLWSVMDAWFLALAVNPATTDSNRLLLVLTDSTGTRGYRSGASLHDVQLLLDGLRAMASWALRPDSAPPPPRDGTSSSCPVKDPHLHQQETDVAPEYLGSRAPTYPESEREAGQSGRVLLQLLVDSLGRVDPRHICVILTDGLAFTQSALTMVRHARFKPGVRAGRPVPVVVILPVDYRIRR